MAGRVPIVVYTVTQCIGGFRGAEQAYAPLKSGKYTFVVIFYELLAKRIQLASLAYFNSIYNENNVEGQ